MTTLQKTKDHGGVRGYLKQSREPLTAAIAVLPLFVAYQVGILVAGGARNGVDFVSDLLRWAFGGDLGTYLIFNAVVLVGFVGAVVVLRRKGELHPRVLPLMLLECSVYAVLVGGLVNTLIHLTGLSGLLAAGGSAPGLLTKIVLSAGAGLYEELVFRLMMMGGLFWVLHKVGGLGRVAASLLTRRLTSRSASPISSRNRRICSIPISPSPGISETYSPREAVIPVHTAAPKPPLTA